jgi:5-oxoprolinase (ATP-hydrolysing)
VERFAHAQVLEPLAEAAGRLPAILDELGRGAVAEVIAEGIPATGVEVRRQLVNLRLAGQETSIEVPMGPALETEFATRYQAMYGHHPEGKPVEVESVRVVASSLPAQDDGRETSSGHTARIAVEGPATVFDSHTAYVVDPGWSGSTDEAGALVLRRQPREAAARQTTAVRSELFTNRFMSIARQMGRMLERTALSTNVKERLDFSCALLDADGELVAHAPHMPVHLGALGLCVRAVRDELDMGPGDVVMTNHPSFGGSHIPDITVVTPIHHGDRLIGYAASRAHHAEIGGIRPGSMPPLATALAEEGVVVLPEYVVRGGNERFDAIERLFAGGPYPSRAIADNLADLRAAIAANRHGALALAGLAAEYGAAVIAEQMDALKHRAETLARAALAALPDGEYRAEQQLDDGSPIRVRIDLHGNGAVIDFAGTADRHPGNLNATPAVVLSAVLYVLRVMIGEGLPLNEGIMRAVDVRIPRGMLNPEFPADPRHAPAVGGGNVETSQRIVDTLFQALGIAACSQGTMNNTLFGTERFSYYETVCGGSGAGPGFAGTDAVHTHMTNTRITDPEILEHRYPVRLDRFAIRKDSGGAGRYRGGDGAVREITFLEPMSLSILSQHRGEGPYGARGGAPGEPGAQHIVRADGTVETLGSVAGTEVAPGDRLVMKTPGAGGWGKCPQVST